MKNIILSLCCGLLGAMVFTVAQSYLYSRPIAVVRMDDIIASHLKTYGEKELSDAQRKALSEQFARSLDRVIQQVGEQQRVTLLVSPAVVSNAPDYTEFVKSEIRRSLDGE
jgi:type-F conjugative transfer system protein TrbI